MKITPEQEKIIDSFVCERLSSNAENELLMQSFESKRGESLVDYLKCNGISEDVDGKTAYYVVKNEKNEIMLFFSLKCGALFVPLLDEDEVKQDYQRLVTLLQAIKNAQGNGSEMDEASAIFRKYKVNDRISAKDFRKILEKAEEKSKYLNHLSKDREMEDNEKIIRVLSTYPGVELVHFCSNDNVAKNWKKYGLGHTMGEVLFWKFAAPKFFEVQEIVGCEYAFLFAADLSEDGSLVNYYDVTLKFQKRLDIGTSKPFYDFCCDFMCQELNDMKLRRKNFFDNFNIDESAEDIV